MEKLKQIYLVCVEPSDPQKWFFLGESGKISKINTVDANWNHQPTREQILNHLNDNNVLEDNMKYYIIEPSLSKTKKNDIDVRVIGKGDFKLSEEKIKDNEVVL